MNQHRIIDMALSTPPLSHFKPWTIAAIQNISDEFFLAHEDFLYSMAGEIWFLKLFKRGHTPAEAAAIIVRAYLRFNNSQIT